MVLVFAGFVGLTQVQQAGALDVACRGILCPKLVTPAAPDFVDLTCTEDGSYTINATTGVMYWVKIDSGIWLPKSAGTYVIGSGHTVYVNAYALPGYDLIGTKSWSYTFIAPDCTVTPIAVSFEGPNCETREMYTYTIPTSEHLKYFVDSVEQTVGVHSVPIGTAVTITAVADEGYTLSGTAEWTDPVYVAKTSEECELGVQDVTPSAPVFTAATCGALGYYTIPVAEGVKYYVGDEIVAVGNHTVANGITITINAVADEGYSIKEGATNQWIYTFNAAANCGGGGSVLGATTLPDTSGGAITGSLTIIAIIAAFIAVIGVAVRSYVIKRV